MCAAGEQKQGHHPHVCVRGTSSRLFLSDFLVHVHESYRLLSFVFLSLSFPTHVQKSNRSLSPSVMVLSFPFLSCVYMYLCLLKWIKRVTRWKDQKARTEVHTECRSRLWDDGSWSFISQNLETSSWRSSLSGYKFQSESHFDCLVDIFRSSSWTELLKTMLWFPLQTLFYKVEQRVLVWS